jgi:hypothetical protein
MVIEGKHLKEWIGVAQREIQVLSSISEVKRKMENLEDYVKGESYQEIYDTLQILKNFSSSNNDLQKAISSKLNYGEEKLSEFFSAWSKNVNHDAKVLLDSIVYPTINSSFALYTGNSTITEKESAFAQLQCSIEKSTLLLEKKFISQYPPLELCELRDAMLKCVELLQLLQWKRELQAQISFLRQEHSRLKRMDQIQNSGLIELAKIIAEIEKFIKNCPAIDETSTQIIEKLSIVKSEAQFFYTLCQSESWMQYQISNSQNILTLLIEVKKNLFNLDFKHSTSLLDESKTNCNSLMEKSSTTVIPEKEICQRLQQNIEKMSSYAGEVHRNFENQISEFLNYRKALQCRKPELIKKTQTCSICSKKFGVIYMRLQKWCKKCGIVVCDKCSSRKKCIPELAYFHNVRVCDKCVDQTVELKFVSNALSLQPFMETIELINVSFLQTKEERMLFEIPLAISENQ